MKKITRCTILSAFLGTLICAPVSANACSCRGATDMKSQFIRAQDVLIAEVTDTSLVKTVHKEHDLEYIVANIQVLEHFKQSPDNKPITKVIDLVPEAGNCSIALISGMEYVFFVDDYHYEDEESEMGWIREDHYVGRCTGSHRVNPYSINFDEEYAALKELSALNEKGELKPDQPPEEDKDTVFFSDSFKLND